LARPLLRNAKKSDEMTEDEAKNLIETCLKVLFYRDARALDRVQIATVSARGVQISAPYDLKTDWDVGHILYPGYNVKNTNYLGNVNQ
jgi:20S proteasome subunit beta 7